MYVMTTKTQLAMFAIATVAIMSFSFIPAFAQDVGHSLPITAPSSGEAKKVETDRSVCNGTGKVITTGYVSTNPEDYVKIIADASDCQSHTKTTGYVTVNNNHFGSFSTSDDYKKFTFSGNLNVGDKVIVAVTYTT